ncbi:hypothetical protein Tco_0728093 [Tanacetum coccineum]|uniref:Synaptobrevin, longin-like domain protein n=1 Tax=Tanacetum coccineum TaxID=301880 RepID=A0ABQ4YL09_9ASTR
MKGGIVHVQEQSKTLLPKTYQEEAFDYVREVFAAMARIEAIKNIPTAYLLYGLFTVYQMDVKSTSFIWQIEERCMYVNRPVLKIPDHPDKVYKVLKSNSMDFIKHPAAWISFQMSSIGELTYFFWIQVQQEEGASFSESKINMSNEILRKFNYSDVKFASTPTDLEKPLVKDGDADDCKVCQRSAEASTAENGEVKINVTIDGHSLSITEGSLRRHLKLADQDGITSIPTSEIFKQLALMGYHTDSDKLTFQKGAFSPQWRFLIHNILHCLSPKKTAWEQFSSNIAAAIICLATNRKFNFSRMIFEHMVSNISSPHKFLMYPRFIQICLDMQRHQLQQHTRIYPVPSLSMKESHLPLPLHLHLPPNLTPTSTPSPTQPSPTQPSPTQPSPTQPSPTQPSPTQPSPTQPGTEHHLPTPHDSPLHAVHSHGSDEGSLKLQELMNLVTTLSDRIGVLEADLMKTKKTYNDEVFEDDSSKQGRKLADAEVQEKASTDTELFIQEVTPTEVIQDQEGSEKASDEVSTAGAKKGTASEEVPIVSTAEVNPSTAGGTVTYSRRSAEKRSRQDKGKAIMIEEEPKKKSKKELEQERLSYAEAIRLEEQMNEEQRAQIARDEEIARQWDEEERQRAMDEAKSAKKIDWNDPSVIRYHTQKMKPKTVAQARRNMIKYLKNQGNCKINDFKGMYYNDIRPIFENVWDFNQNFEPMDAEHGSGKQKSL